VRTGVRRPAGRQDRRGGQIADLLTQWRSGELGHFLRGAGWGWRGVDSRAPRSAAMIGAEVLSTLPFTISLRRRFSAPNRPLPLPLPEKVSRRGLSRRGLCRRTGADRPSEARVYCARAQCNPLTGSGVSASGQRRSWRPRPSATQTARRHTQTSESPKRRGFQTL
jgi:hypothetical protein